MAMMNQHRGTEVATAVVAVIKRRRKAAAARGI